MKRHSPAEKRKDVKPKEEKRLKKGTAKRERVNAVKKGINKINFLCKLYNGKKIKCINLKNMGECLEYIHDTDIFAFDEAQFYSNDIIDICKKLLLKDKRVIIAGLDRDSNGMPFGQMPYILAHADYITKLNAVCVKCGDIATFSYRISKDKEQIVLGEKEKYEARCIICFHEK